MNIKKTIALLQEADEAYHAGSDSLMSDREYDELKAGARKEDPTNPYFKAVGAPVKGVAWKVRRHQTPMGSIQNLDLNDPLGDFTRWWIKVGRPGLLVQPKLDGLSLELEYDLGKLVAAILRGDGVEGEDVLRNALLFGIPVEVDLKIKNIRGEVLLGRKALAEVNKLQEGIGEKPYANCRNAAAGIVRRLDGRYANRLRFVAFESDSPFPIEELRLCNLFGGAVVETVFTPDVPERVVDAVTKFYNSIMEGDRSGRAEFCCDGVVVKAAFKEDRERIGGDSLLPDWIRALKFPPEEGRFTVDDIHWFVGKTGKLTPVLHSHVGTQFKDKVVHEVTLHNYAYFCRLKLSAGDKVSVVISGDVIPKAGEVLERGSGEMFQAPKECPECKSLLRVEETFLWCDSKGCQGRAKALTLAHVREMGIDEMGPELVARLFEAGRAGKIRFSDEADLYTLRKADFLKLEGFGEKSAEKVLDNIRARMEPDLPTFIASLGIPSVGARMIEKIGAPDIDSLLKLGVLDLKKVEGIGEKMAVQISTGLNERYHLIGRLLAAGVKIKMKRKAVAKGNALGGRSFCFTGDVKEINPDTGKSWDREEVWALVEENGGVVKSGVSKKLDVLVLADPSSASSKARKAREYGVECISSEVFLKLCGV